MVKASDHTKIAFEVSFKEPQTHYVDVKMSISDIQTKQLEIKIRDLMQVFSYLTIN